MVGAADAKPRLRVWFAKSLNVSCPVSVVSEHGATFSRTCWLGYRCGSGKARPVNIHTQLTQAAFFSLQSPSELLEWLPPGSTHLLQVTRQN